MHINGKHQEDEVHHATPPVPTCSMVTSLAKSLLRFFWSSLCLTGRDENRPRTETVVPWARAAASREEMRPWWSNSRRVPA